MPAWPAARRARGGKGGRGAAAKALPWLVSALAAGVVCWCAYSGFSSLRRMALEPCTITNAAGQVKITFGSESDGRRISKEWVADYFRLTNGVNLATVDFAGRRASMLERQPIVKDVSVEWNRARNEVGIDVQERIPAMRLAGRGWPDSRYVCDAEGVVLDMRQANLPALLLPPADVKQGETLAGRAQAALRLAAALKTHAPDLVLRSLDVRKREYVTAEFAKPYPGRARIAWSGMDGDAAGGDGDLPERLRRLSPLLKNRQWEDRKLWDATDSDPKRITAK